MKNKIIGYCIVYRTSAKTFRPAIHDVRMPIYYKIEVAKRELMEKWGIEKFKILKVDVKVYVHPLKKYGK